MHKLFGLAGVGFCLLAGVFSVGGDSARADAAAALTGAVGNAADNAARQTFNIARQSFDLGDIAADAANGASMGDSLAAFRRNAQLRLLAAIDKELSAQSADILRERFSAIKAEVDMQTALGGRKAHVGANLIGAISESPDDVFGWQMRVYGGQEDSKGVNSGFFYRRMIDGEVLVGANMFSDYESHRHGHFVRYSFGGEVQSRNIELAANYYVPTTKERTVNREVIAFSRKGYDAKVRLNAPHLQEIKGGVDYYKFSGKRGRGDDEGFRIGGEWYPSSAFRMGLFYDSNKDKWGGDVGYAWTIGEEQGRATSGGGAFAPDLLAPVWREHSQRIVLATVGASPPSYNRLAADGVPFGGVAVIGRLDINAGFYDRGIYSVSVSDNVSNTGGNIRLTAVNAGMTVVRIDISGLSGGATSMFSFLHTINVLRAGEPDFIPSAMTLLLPVSMAATIGILSTMDGYFDSGLAVNLPPNVALESGGNVVYTPQMTGEMTLTISVTGMPPELNRIFMLPVSVYEGVMIIIGDGSGGVGGIDDLALIHPPDMTSVIGTITASGGVGAHTFRVMSDGDIRHDAASGELRIITPEAQMTIRTTATIIASDADIERTADATLVLTITSTPLPPMAVMNYYTSVYLHFRDTTQRPGSNGVTIGTVTVVRANGGPFTYELGTPPAPSRFRLDETTGEMRFLDDRARQLAIEVIARGMHDGMMITLTTTVTMNWADEGQACAFTRCPALGINPPNVPTTAQLEMLRRAGFEFGREAGGGRFTGEDGDLNGVLGQFMYQAGVENRMYDQMQLSVLWDYLREQGEDINTDLRVVTGDPHEFNRGTPLDFANLLPDAANNWLVNLPISPTTGPRCQQVCQAGQRRLSDNALCVRSTPLNDIRATPIDCTVAN